MSHWTADITRNQVNAARRALGRELMIADHIQARRSEIDGWATVEVFVGRRCYTVSLGPKGGVKSKESAIVE
jgi:hypothetical protein